MRGSSDNDKHVKPENSNIAVELTLRQDLRPVDTSDISLYMGKSNQFLIDCPVTKTKKSKTNVENV